MVTREQVQEIVDKGKDPWQVQVLLWIFRGVILLIFWKSIEYIYFNGFNQYTLSGLGIGISTTIIILLIIHVVKVWFGTFMGKIRKNLNNVVGSN